MPGLVIIHPVMMTDARGSFTKTFVAETYMHAGLATTFAEEYHTRSTRGVLRGMHFQRPPFHHDKVVFCTSGSAVDVILDLRRGSPWFGRALEFHLEAATGFGLYIPAGCAHGFCSVSDDTTMTYRVTAAYSPEHDAGILWSSIAADWPFAEPIISERDSSFPRFEDFDSPFTYPEV